MSARSRPTGPRAAHLGARKRASVVGGTGEPAQRREMKAKRGEMNIAISPKHQLGTNGGPALILQWRKKRACNGIELGMMISWPLRRLWAIMLPAADEAHRHYMKAKANIALYAEES